MRLLAAASVAGCAAIAFSPPSAPDNSNTTASLNAMARTEGPQLAAIHDIRTGVRADSSRTLAAR